MNRHDTGRGIALSVAATTLFALLSVYTRILRPLGGLDIFAWRIVWTVPGALLLVWMRGRRGELLAIARASLRAPIKGLMLLLASAWLGTQLWRFICAPLHGRRLEGVAPFAGHGGRGGKAGAGQRENRKQLFHLVSLCSCRVSSGLSAGGTSRVPALA